MSLAKGCSASMNMIPDMAVLMANAAYAANVEAR
jgi:hypothetical protein